MDFDTFQPAETRPTLLLVTGDADLRAVTARVLTREGYHVITAAHSGHALLASLTGPIDILVSELELEETSGPALVATLLQHHPRLRAVYFGDAGTPAADGVLVRPFTRDDLVLELDAVGAPATLAS
jgi:DNA-binding NtrC family response regulator